MKAIINLIFLAFLCLSFNINESLDGSVTGQIIGTNDQPIGHLEVQLLDAIDSTLVKANYTDANGKFVFYNIDAGIYRVVVTGMGYEKKHSFMFTLNYHDKKYQLPKLTVQEN